MIDLVWYFVYQDCKSIKPLSEKHLITSFRKTVIFLKER